MKIGILELRDYEFMRDVARVLGENAEFISLADFDPLQGNRYRVIIDRLSFQDTYLRQFLKSASLGGCYVINNPFAADINNKILDGKLAASIGVRHPKTMILPKFNPDWEATDPVKEPDWEELRKKITLPCIVKPFDGYAWEKVFVAASYREVENLYNALKQKHILLVQEKVEYTDYFRVFCVGKKDVLIAKWEPKAMGLGVYSHPGKNLLEQFGESLSEASLKMNMKLDLDFNAIEFCIDEDGKICMIDAMNEVPDVMKNVLPQDFYGWLVDKFAKCALEKHGSSETNRSTFPSE
jgi:glutathione synthase/RimK-type ligase-like ATP-grasp enzyme